MSASSDVAQAYLRHVHTFEIAGLHHLAWLTDRAQPSLKWIAVRAAPRLGKHRPRQLTEVLLLTLR